MAKLQRGSHYVNPLAESTQGGRAGLVDGRQLSDIDDDVHHLARRQLINLAVEGHC